MSKRSCDLASMFFPVTVEQLSKDVPVLLPTEGGSILDYS